MRFTDRLIDKSLILLGKSQGERHPQRVRRGDCGAGLVNTRSANIFNGFLLVLVNEKIPALNSI
jgi:hypothetical protein